MKEEELSLTKCFGKVKNCERSCAYKSVCQDKYKEERESSLRMQYRETKYIDEMGGEPGDSSLSLPYESSSCYTDKEVLRAIDELDIPEVVRRELYRVFRMRELIETASDWNKELLRRLGELYINDPTGFEVLFFQILAGGNQAELARRRGCTKQNINKIITKGKKRLEAYRQMVESKPGCRLSFRELAVFRALEVENLTYRKTAELIGCSYRTVGNIAQK